MEALDMGKRGRPPKLTPDGRMQRQLPPTQRGYTTISVREEIAERLANWMQQNGVRSRPEAVKVLLDQVEAKNTGSSIDWDRIEEAVREVLGAKWGSKANEVMNAIKAALE